MGGDIERPRPFSFDPLAIKIYESLQVLFPVTINEQIKHPPRVLRKYQFVEQDVAVDFALCCLK